jgi:hypothetical protein
MGPSRSGQASRVAHCPNALKGSPLCACNVASPALGQLGACAAFRHAPPPHRPHHAPAFLSDSLRIAHFRGCPGRPTLHRCPRGSSRVRGHPIRLQAGAFQACEATCESVVNIDRRSRRRPLNPTNLLFLIDNTAWYTYNRIGKVNFLRLRPHHHGSLERFVAELARGLPWSGRGGAFEAPAGLPAGY